MVAEPDRLRERDQQAGDEVPDRLLSGEADNDSDHGRRRENPSGNRAHLRDHEQRREEADEDDCREDAAAQDAVAGDRGGRQVAAGHAPVDEARDDQGHE